MPDKTYSIEITAQTAQFQSAMAKASASVKSLSKDVKSAFSGLQGAAAALGVGLSVGGLVALVKGAIDANDRLADLSKSTGVAVETLGGLGFAAKQSGTDLDGVAKAFSKFNVEIAKGAGGNAEALASFAKVGVSIDDLKNKTPEEVLFKVADAFEKYADGPNKAAIGNELFKKSYQDIIPLLDEGGVALRAQVEYFQRFSGVTEETARRADAFNDSVEKAKLLSGAFAQNLASKLLPSLQALVNVYADAKEKGDGFSSTADRIVDGLKFIAKGAAYAVAEFVDLGDLIGSLAARAAALARLDFGAIKSIGADREERLKQSKADLQKLVEAIDNPPVAQLGPKRPKPKAPGVEDAGRGNDAYSAAKKILDGQIKAIEESTNQEEELLKARQDYLKGYFELSLVSERDYYAGVQAAQQEGLAIRLKGYNDQVELLRDFLSKAKNDTDREDLNNKIAETINKSVKAQQEATRQGNLLWLSEQQAAQKYKGEIEDITAKLAEMQGDTVGSTFERTKKQFAGILKQAQDKGDSGSVAAIQRVVELTNKQAELDKATKDYSRTLGDLQDQQAHIDIAFQSGGIGEIEMLRQRSEATKSYIATLTQQLQIAETIAQQTGDEAAIAAVRRLKTELEALAAQGDLVAKKFQDVFQSSFTDALTEAIDGTKSLKDAFKDMEHQIVQSISRIASQNIAQAIFGGGGPGAGIGGIFSSIFGGSGGNGGGFGDLIVKLFGAAGGVDNWRGGPLVVGERGPELVNLPQGAQVIPNSQFNAARAARGATVIQHINVMPGATTRSATQAANLAGIEVQRAIGRNS